jgi:hypothetical protein
MSDGNTWHEAYSRSSLDLPEVKWEMAYRPTVEKPVEPTPVAPTLSSSELEALAQSYINGSKEKIDESASILVSHKSNRLINMLFQVANGSKTKDVWRRKAAILTIAHMADSSNAQAVSQGLLSIRKSVDMNPSICMALGIIGHPLALPHLYKILRDGIGIVILANYSVEQQNSFAIYTRAYALVAIAMIGNRESMAPLVLDVDRELVCQDYSDDSDNALSNSSNLGLALLGVAASVYANKRKNARAAASMVDPDVGLSTVIEFPAATKMAWMLQHRVSMLKVLCSMHGIEILDDLMPQAKTSLQRLFISLPVTQLGNTKAKYINPMTDSALSSNRIERALAYDGLVKVYAMSNIPELESWVLRGLSDKDSAVRTATAASLLYNKAGKLVQNALAFSQSKSIDERMGVMPPLMHLAIRGELFAVEALNRVAKTDPDKDLREMAIEFMQNLKKAQDMYSNDVETAEEGIDSEETTHQEASETASPSWSPFTPKLSNNREEPNN